MKKKILIIPIIAILLLIIMPNVNASGFLSEMPNGSYIIGKTLYTRSTFEEYKGVLTTEFIMKASKTINEDELDSMIIYYKSPRGVLMNALTGQQVEENESDLMDNVEYYNGVKIPNLGLTSFGTINNEKTDYTISLSDNPLAGGGIKGFWIDYDLYGAKEWNGVIPNFPGGVTPAEPSNEDLVLIAKDVRKNFPGGYIFSLNNGIYYSYVAYPFITNGDDKIYLSTDSITLYAGARVIPNIVNNQINLTVSGINNYTITGATLYASRDKEKTTPHIETKDLIYFVKDNNDYINVLSNNYLSIMNIIAKEKSGYLGSTDRIYAWYIADIYSNLNSDSPKTTITLGDLGNSEKEKNYYKADVTISSQDILEGRPITIVGDYKVEGIVHQMPIDNLNENEWHLFNYVGLISSLIDQFGGDIDLSDLIS